MKRPRWFGWIFSAVAGLVCLFAMLVALEWFLPRDESKIISSIESLAKIGTPDDYISQYDLICFNHDNMRVADEFRNAASKKGVDVSASLQSCGVERTCCPMTSDVGGTIGLIKGDKVRCIDINRIAFLVADGVGICAKPAALNVKQEIFTERVNPAGRPWFANPGQSYYRISERWAPSP